MCETKSFEYNIRKTRLCLTLLYFMYIHKLSTLSMFVLNCYNIYMLTISNQGSQTPKTTAMFTEASSQVLPEHVCRFQLSIINIWTCELTKKLVLFNKWVGFIYTVSTCDRLASLGMCCTSLNNYRLYTLYIWLVIVTFRLLILRLLIFSKSVCTFIYCKMHFACKKWQDMTWLDYMQMNTSHVSTGMRLTASLQDQDAK